MAGIVPVALGPQNLSFTAFLFLYFCYFAFKCVRFKFGCFSERFSWSFRNWIVGKRIRRTRSTERCEPRILHLLIFPTSFLIRKSEKKKSQAKDFSKSQEKWEKSQTDDIDQI